MAREDALKRPLNHMSDRKKQFALNILSGMSKRQAAIEAGYSPTSGSASERLMKDPAVKSILTKANNSYTKVVQEKIHDTFSRNVSMLTEIAEENMQADARVSVAAIAELNKMFGNYSAEKHINVNVNVSEDVQKVKLMLDQFVAEKQKEY